MTKLMKELQIQTKISIRHRCGDDLLTKLVHEIFAVVAIHPSLAINTHSKTRVLNTGECENADVKFQTF